MTLYPAKRESLFLSAQLQYHQEEKSNNPTGPRAGLRAGHGTGAVKATNVRDVRASAPRASRMAWANTLGVKGWGKIWTSSTWTPLSITAEPTYPERYSTWISRCNCKSRSTSYRRDNSGMTASVAQSRFPVGGLPDPITQLFQAAPAHRAYASPSTSRIISLPPGEADRAEGLAGAHDRFRTLGHQRRSGFVEGARRMSPAWHPHLDQTISTKPANASSGVIPHALAQAMNSVTSTRRLAVSQL